MTKRSESRAARKNYKPTIRTNQSAAAKGSTVKRFIFSDSGRQSS